MFWESIDENLYYEAGEKEIVQVTNTQTYINKMSEQNKRVLTYLQATYPNRTFRLSKWHSHDFGQYQEIEELFVTENDDDDDFNLYQ